MQPNLCLKSQFLTSEHFFILQPLIRNTNSFRRVELFASKYPYSAVSLSLSLDKAQIQESVICAGKKRRRNGSHKSRQFELRLAWIVASNLGILPQPLDRVMGDLGGVDRLWLRDWKGFGRGLSFNGCQVSRKNSNFITWSLLGFCGLVILSKGDMKIEAVLGVAGFGLFAASLIKKCKRRVLRGWISALAIFSFGLLMGFGWKGETAMKWMTRNGVCSSMVDIWGRGKKIGGRNSYGRRI